MKQYKIERDKKNKLWIILELCDCDNYSCNHKEYGERCKKYRECGITYTKEEAEKQIKLFLFHEGKTKNYTEI